MKRILSGVSALFVLVYATMASAGVATKPPAAAAAGDNLLHKTQFGIHLSIGPRYRRYRRCHVRTYRRGYRRYRRWVCAPRYRSAYYAPYYYGTPYYYRSRGYRGRRYRAPRYYRSDRGFRRAPVYRSRGFRRSRGFARPRAFGGGRSFRGARAFRGGGGARRAGRGGGRRR